MPARVTTALFATSISVYEVPAVVNVCSIPSVLLKVILPVKVVPVSVTSPVTSTLPEKVVELLLVKSPLMVTPPLKLAVPLFVKVFFKVIAPAPPLRVLLFSILILNSFAPVIVYT